MSIEYKRPFNGTLAAGSNTLLTSANGKSQIRAITVFNPTASSVTLKVSIAGKQYIQRDIAQNASSIIPELINQQVEKTEVMTAEGEGLNIMLSVAEIV